MKRFNKNSENRITILLHLSRGAKSRKRILELLNYGPKNCNQIAKTLELDWWTVQKHLQFLVTENIIEVICFGRRKLYNLTADGKEALKLTRENENAKQCEVPAKT